jgi:hypothetical protein
MQVNLPHGNLHLKAPCVELFSVVLAFEAHNINACSKHQRLNHLYLRVNVQWSWDLRIKLLMSELCMDFILGQGHVCIKLLNVIILSRWSTAYTACFSQLVFFSWNKYLIFA